MLTDDERKTINHAADVLGPSLRDLATRLRAIAAPRVATVGELLAKAPAGAIEFCASAEESRLVWQVVICEGTYGASDSTDCRFWNVDEWEEWRAIGDWRFPASNYRQPARIVPASEADRDPSTRGPIGEG